MFHRIAVALALLLVFGGQANAIEVCGWLKETVKRGRGEDAAGDAGEEEGQGSVAVMELGPSPMKWEREGPSASALGG
jgi:hypothetical protein